MRKKPLTVGIRLSIASLLIPTASYSSMIVTYKSLSGTTSLLSMPLTIVVGVLAFAISARYYWRAFPRS